MKKLLLMVAGVLGAAGLYASDKPGDESTSSFGLALDTSVKFQTDYAYRGRKELGKVFIPSVEIGYPAFEGGTIYTGADAVLGIGSVTFGNRISPYFGVTYDVTDMFRVDVGYVHNFHTSLGPRHVVFFKDIDEYRLTESMVKRNTSEFYAGVIAEVLLTPSLYVSYDAGRREISLEGEVGYTFDLSQYSIQGLGIDLGAKLGFDSARRPYGMDYDSDIHGKKGYLYYGVSADLVYGVNSNAKAKVGVAYEGNSAKKKSWVYHSDDINGQHKNVVWFNASVDCSF
jgi:hypothetical protein